jgi:preprotein translocase subunit SecG
VQALILILLVLIVGSLGHALSSMSSTSPDPARSARMAQALTVRITLSVALFALLLIGYHFGWITPRGTH